MVYAALVRVSQLGACLRADRAMFTGMGNDYTGFPGNEALGKSLLRDICILRLGVSD